MPVFIHIHVPYGHFCNDRVAHRLAQTLARAKCRAHEWCAGPADMPLEEVVGRLNRLQQERPDLQAIVIGGSPWLDAAARRHGDAFEAAREVMAPFHGQKSMAYMLGTAPALPPRWSIPDLHSIQVSQPVISTQHPLSHHTGVWSAAIWKHLGPRMAAYQSQVALEEAMAPSGGVTRARWRL